MSRAGIAEHAALERLRLLSQREDRKLPEIGRRIVDEAVARPRAWNPQSQEPHD
jgi:hypothetical protein